jgi:hypothetical protein
LADGPFVGVESLATEKSLRLMNKIKDVEQIESFLMKKILENNWIGKLKQLA